MSPSEDITEPSRCGPRVSQEVGQCPARLITKCEFEDIDRLNAVDAEAAEISTQFRQRLYAPVDAADKESCRPDFAVGVYPGHLRVGDRDYNLNPNVPVTRQTSPTFLVQAEDDGVDGVGQTLAYYMALKNASVPVEMHLYAQGGHAFGLRPTKQPITAWPKLVDTWLETIGML